MKRLHLYILYKIFFGIILISGVVSPETLCAQIQTATDSLYHTRISIDSLYKQEHLKGFFDIDISYMENKDSLIINKGMPISRIILTPPIPSPNNLSGYLKDSIILKPEEMKPYIKRILNAYNNNGYPFTRIKLTGIKRQDSIIHAGLYINRYEKRSIDSIIFYGYQNLPRKLFYQHAQVFPGAVLNLSRIRGIEEAIKNTGIGHTTRSPELLFTRDSTFLFVYMKKKNDNRFDGILGFSYDGKWKLTGNMNLQIHNTFNKGELLEIKWISQTEKLNLLEVTGEYPYLLDSPVGAGLNYRIEKTDTTSVNNALSLGTYYSLTNGNTLGLVWQRGGGYYTLEHSEDKAYTYNRFGLSFHFIKKKHIATYAFDQLTTYGKRNNEKQAYTSLRYHVSIKRQESHNRWILAGKSAYLYAENYLPHELLKTGGANSIRGFDENSFSATAYAIHSSAYEYALGGQHSIGIFADLGYIKQLDSVSLWAIGTGVGYSYSIKDGRVSLEYAIGNTNLSPFSLNNSKIHLKYLVIF